MSTTFYIKNDSIGLGTYNKLSSPLRSGDAATSVTGTTTSGGTWISLGYWATKPLVAFSLSGTVSFNFRAAESNAQANASLGMRIYKYSNGALGSSLGQASATTELGTSEAVITGSVTPTTTTFNAGDILVVEIGIINIGTMGNARTVTFYYDGPIAGASGDSYFTITPTITRQRRVQNTE